MSLFLWYYLDVILPRLAFKMSSLTWILIRTLGFSLRPEYNFRLISLYKRSQKACRRSLRESSVGYDISSNHITRKLFSLHGLHSSNFSLYPLKRLLTMFLALSTYYLHWVNIPVCSFSFLVILVLSFCEFINKSLRNLTFLLRSVVRHFEHWHFLHFLCIFHYLAHVRWVIWRLGTNFRFFDTVTSVIYVKVSIKLVMYNF